MKRIYVAGPMTGLPRHNKPTFHATTKRLRAAGFHVENPAENELDEDAQWADWMRVSLRQMLLCDAVVVLPGWELSRGAQLEVQTAQALGLPCLDETAAITRAVAQLEGQA